MTDNEQIGAMMEAAEMYQRQHETNGGNEMINARDLASGGEMKEKRVEDEL